MATVVQFPGCDSEALAVGRRVRQWREQRGVTMEDLARAARVEPAELRAAEAGRFRLDSAQLHAITHHLHLPLHVLFEDRLSWPTH